MDFFHSLPVPDFQECLFFIPFPFPNFGNGLFNSLPVPELWEWNFLFPFPFPNPPKSFPLTPGEDDVEEPSSLLLQPNLVCHVESGPDH